MQLLDLCAGIGGFSLAAHWLGWQTVAFCEKDAFCQKILAKNFPRVPIYDDVFTFPSESFRGRVSTISAGFPCQPFSVAGKRTGKDDERHIFPRIREIVDIVRPRFCVFENVRGLLSIGNGDVFEEIASSLEDIGYSVQTLCIPASALNAPHRRDRLWIVAHSNCDEQGLQRQQERGVTGVRGGPQRYDFDANDTLNGEHRTDANNAGSRTSRSEPDAKQPPLGGERQQSQSEPCGHAADAANTDIGGRIRRPEQGEIRERQVDSGRGNDRPLSELTVDSGNNAFGVPRNSKGTGQPCGFSGSGQEEYGRTSTWTSGWSEQWTSVAARLCGVSYGFSDELHIVGSRDNRVNRLKALGNAIVPQIAYEIFRAIQDAEYERQRS